MATIIAFPLNKVLELIAIFATIEDVANFIFKIIVNFNWWGRGGIEAVDPSHAMEKGDQHERQDVVL